MLTKKVNSKMLRTCHHGHYWSERPHKPKKFKIARSRSPHTERTIAYKLYAGCVQYFLYAREPNLPSSAQDYNRLFWLNHVIIDHDHTVGVRDWPDFGISTSHELFNFSLLSILSCSANDLSSSESNSLIFHFEKWTKNQLLN